MCTGGAVAATIHGRPFPSVLAASLLAPRKGTRTKRVAKRVAGAEGAQPVAQELLVYIGLISVKQIHLLEDTTTPQKKNHDGFDLFQQSSMFYLHGFASDTWKFLRHLQCKSAVNLCRSRYKLGRSYSCLSENLGTGSGRQEAVRVRVGTLELEMAKIRPMSRCSFRSAQQSQERSRRFEHVVLRTPES